MEGGPPDDLEPSRRAGPQSAPDQLEVSHQPGGLQVRKDQKAAVVSPQIWRSRLRRLTTAGHYAEAVEVIESGWDGSQLRGADRLLALVAVASEGRFELVDRLAEGVKGAGTRRATTLPTSSACSASRQRWPPDRQAARRRW
jgi:hypothetical protein